MKFPTLPSFVVAALLAGAIAILQHLALNIDGFHLGELYAPIAVITINTLVKMAQEAQAQRDLPLERGLTDVRQPDDYWQRVIYK